MRQQSRILVHPYSIPNVWVYFGATYPCEISTTSPSGSDVAVFDKNKHLYHGEQEEDGAVAFRGFRIA